MAPNAEAADKGEIMNSIPYKNRVALVVPIAPAEAFQKIRKTRMQEFKSSIVRNYEAALSAATGRLHLTDYHHTITNHSNRGDIAIGEASLQAVNEIWHHGVQVDIYGWGELSEDIVKPFNEKYDAIILGGGGYVFLNGKGELNHRSRDINIFERLNMPIIAYGIGLNRLMFEDTYDLSDINALPAETKNYLERFCNRVDVMSVRDRSAYRLMQEFSTREVFLTGDPVLVYKPPPVNKYKPVLQDNYVGVNMAAHGWRAIVVLKKVLPALEHNLRIISKTEHLNYFVHENMEYPVGKFLSKRGVKVDWVDGTTDLMLKKYGECKFVISQMLHSAIFAFNAGTPVINIAYDLKCTAFFELFGLERFCIPWRAASKEVIGRLIRDVAQDNVAIRNAITEGKKKLCSDRDRFIARSRSTLN